MDDKALHQTIKRRIFEEGSALPQHLGIDETSFQKRHEYVTMIGDQDKGHVVSVADGQTKESVSEYLKTFDEAERSRVNTSISGVST